MEWTHGHMHMYTQAYACGYMAMCTRTRTYAGLTQILNFGPRAKADSALWPEHRMTLKVEYFGNFEALFEMALGGFYSFKNTRGGKSRDTVFFSTIYTSKLLMLFQTF
jgi:hypothetical protein